MFQRWANRSLGMWKRSTSCHMGCISNAGGRRLFRPPVILVSFESSMPFHMGVNQKKKGTPWANRGTGLVRQHAPKAAPVCS